MNLGAGAARASTCGHYPIDQREPNDLLQGFPHVRLAIIFKPLRHLQLIL